MKRTPQFSGSFYESDPQKLREQMDMYFNNELPLKEKIDAKFVMLPHAGHMYSGAVCAKTLCEVNMGSTVIILGTNHRGQGGNLGIWSEGSWETPLGGVPIATELMHKLMLSPFVADTLGHVSEHSIEVILPFLLHYVPDLKIIPITVSSFEGLHEASKILATCIKNEAAQGHKVSIVVSSDMNHFANDEENRRKDTLALDKLLQGDVKGLFQIVRDESISMCGVVPAILGLLTCKELGITSSKLVAYDTSASVSGDYNRVVGYAGVCMW